MLRTVSLGLLAGLVFGIGLVVSGMSNPAKVLNFLDVLGNWDPSLAFVMGGASITAWIGFGLVQRRERPVMLNAFQIPGRNDVDARLLGGAALFGVGWGVGGFCPGPAWTALPLLASGTLVFLPAMLAGMALMRWWIGRDQGAGRRSGADSGTNGGPGSSPGVTTPV